MKLLLDTHVVLWALLDPSRLTPKSSNAIIDPANDVFVSAVNAWEVAVKQSLGKLKLPGPAHVWLPYACSKAEYEWISIGPDDALRVGRLPWHHRDPFDRLLVAQAAAGFTLVTHDQRMGDYNVPILWT